MKYGMTDALGPMVYAEDEGEIFLGRSVTRTTNVSSSTLLKIENEIRRIIDEQYGLARRLLEQNRDKVEALAHALLEWETIDAEQIDDIVSGRPPRPPKAGNGGSAAGASAPPGPGVQGAAQPA
jgi:cell division protease FtsH